MTIKDKEQEDMERVTLYEKLAEYSRTDYYPYHMPGHKRHAAGGMPEDVLGIDITEIGGFDNLHQPEGIILEGQKRAAKLYGAEESFYLVNGSSCGILSAISAAVPMGGHILMARNCHKSAYHAAYLRNLKQSFLYPQIMDEYAIYDALTADQVKEGLERLKEAGEPPVDAVLIVSPTYEGRIADVKAIAETVHGWGIPLIVDEAHGAHLGLAEHFAPNSCMQGADLVIHSVHKTMLSMTQSALLHVNGGRIDRARLRRFLKIYQSTSPSYVLMASIDEAVRQVEKHGKEMFAEFYRNWMWMLERLSACKKLKVLPMDGMRQDIGKLVISVLDTGLTGKELFDILLEQYHLRPEMPSMGLVLAMFTVGDTQEGFQRMTDALLEIDAKLCDGSLSGEAKERGWQDTAKRLLRMRQTSRLPLWSAWDAESELLPLEECAGRAAGDFINLYPPGVPIIMPGEELTAENLTDILHCRQAGLNVQGLAMSEGKALLKVLA